MTTVMEYYQETGVGFRTRSNYRDLVCIIMLMVNFRVIDVFEMLVILGVTA